jgi:ketosteroid isomerase-like protein
LNADRAPQLKASVGRFVTWSLQGGIVKYILTISVLILLSLSQSLSQNSNRIASDDAVRLELSRLEREKDKAHQQGDTPALARIYADDYMAVTANGGTMFKKEILEFFPGRSVFESHRSEDISVRVFGETAVVTGLLKRKFIKDAKPGGEDSLRYTNIYVNRGGEWKIVAAQFTRMKN